MTALLPVAEDMAYRSYPWIRAWCERSGLPESMLERRLQNARTTGASQEAAYFLHDTGEWLTLSQIYSNETRAWLLQWAWRNRVEVPQHVLLTWSTRHSHTDDPPDVTSDPGDWSIEELRA